MKKIDKKVLKLAFINTIPVMAGYVVMGIAFGLLLNNIGFNAIWAFFMGLFIYGGTMQFMAVDLLANQTPLLSVAVVTLLIHARHVFYSISMIDKFKNQGKERDYLFFALTDETYALLNLPINDGIDIRKYNLYVSVLDQFYWIIGDILGCLIGSIITFDITGVDFAMTALFIVIFIEQITTSDKIYPGVIGILSGIISLVFFGADNFLLPAMSFIVIVLIGIYFFKIKNKDEQNNL